MFRSLDRYLPYIFEVLYVITGIAVTVITAGILYIIFFSLLKVIFRKFERDIALVTLNVSAYPALILFVLISLRLTFQRSPTLGSVIWLDRLFLGFIIVSTVYWSLQLFQQVIVYYLKEYARSTEVMWDEVLIPLLEGVIPVAILVAGVSAILQFCFGLNLTGAWVTLGGGAFVIGFAVRDILANFFSGIVLLLDSPFQFGDVIRIEKERGSDTQTGIIRKIGVRVTHLYIFGLHHEIYVPNSMMQSHKISNLSRPIQPVYFSTSIEFPVNIDFEMVGRVMREIVQAHPDTLGDIETKLDCLEHYYDWEYNRYFIEKKENGRKRLLAEGTVNEKLEEIEQGLEALILTLQFAKSGGLSQDDLQTVQDEYDYVLSLMGFKMVQRKFRRKHSFLNLQQVRSSFQAEETGEKESLINLVRDWYRIWLRDPDVVDYDEYILPEIWERKIELLKRRAYGLYQKIFYPFQEETRLDDYVKRLVDWLRERFKQARSEWQEPRVRMEKITQLRGGTYIQFTLNYYVDDIRLEDGERGKRVNSDIHQEIMRNFKDTSILGS
jgi:MscS family membrane protein